MTIRLQATILAILFSLVSTLTAAEQDPQLSDLAMSARGGDPEAQCKYALACKIRGDEKESFRWFLEAARQDSAQAQYEVGVAYSDGVGVEPSEKEAIKWFQASAKNGYPEAQFELGIRYATGEGLKTNFPLAVRWLKEGADQGNIASQCGLGWMYLEGKGVPQNYSEAYFWLNVATAQLAGEEREMCEAKRDEASTKMTPEQLQEAQRLSTKHLTKESPLEDEDPWWLDEDAEDPKEAAHRRQMELERQRYLNQKRLQREQLRELKEIERLRQRRFD